MTDIDYHAAFKAAPRPTVLLSCDDLFSVLDANDQYLAVLDRRRQEVVGQSIFAVFPEDDLQPGQDGQERLRESLQSVRETCESDWLHMMRYDIEKPDEPGAFEERYWHAASSPILGPDGKAVMIVHSVEDATPQVRAQIADEAISG
jgi:PAS domain-containing protein